MSPTSAPVLIGAALVSSPALWGALVDGTMTTETAFGRYLICAGLCWAAFAFLAMLIGPAPLPEAELDPAEAAADTETAS